MIPNADQVANAAEARLYSSDIAIWEAVTGGYFVRSGCQVTAGAGLTVNVAAGVVYNAMGSVAVTAANNFATGIAADATNPKWVLIEVDSTGTISANAGSAAVNPEPPTPTATKTVLAALYIPANATVVEVFSAGANTASKCQIIDKRQVGQLGQYLVFADDTHTLTNPTALTSILNSVPTLPANYLGIGDKIVIEGTLQVINNAGASTVEVYIPLGSNTMLDFTTSSLGSSASARKIKFRIEIIIKSATVCAVGHEIRVSTAGAATPIQVTTTDDAVGGSSGVCANTGTQTIDCQVKFGTSSAGATILMKGFSVTRAPA